MSSQTFSRKIYSGHLLLSDVGYLLKSLPRIVRIKKDDKINKAFIEKIMLVTTAVNGCVYCEWFHAKQALASGIAEEEMQNMLKLQFDADASYAEMMGLLYAQHYAETNRKPEFEMVNKLNEFYGEQTANNIQLAIRMIFFGNLYGNTWDAVLSRFKGVPAKGSKLVFEFIFFLLNFWIMFPFMLVMRISDHSKN